MTQRTSWLAGLGAFSLILVAATYYVTQDARAVASYRTAADQGDAVAQYNLALIYYYGRGVPQDFSQAVAWYRKAADQGHASAQYDLALMYYEGRGTAQDFTQAAAWYRKAADQGYAYAQHNLAVMYEGRCAEVRSPRRIVPCSDASERGVRQDFTQAVAWYRKAADQGTAASQFQLGAMYEDGRGVPQDFRQAVAWYRQAADQGEADAQCSLGRMYQLGQGVPQDSTQAAAWYGKAGNCFAATGR